MAIDRAAGSGALEPDRPALEAGGGAGIGDAVDLEPCVSSRVRMPPWFESWTSSPVRVPRLFAEL